MTDPVGQVSISEIRQVGGGLGHLRPPRRLLQSST
jgi:hypothetical protein